MRKHRLPDGSTLIVRPIRPDDKPLLAEGLARLSPESVYKRFLSPKPSFTRGELRYLTEVDGRDHFAIVAVMEDRPDFLVGVARFVRTKEDPATAEAAIVVGDAFQGIGVGKMLAMRLADEARLRGIRRFQASILGENMPARRLMAAISDRLTSAGPMSRTVDLVAELAAA